jgi:hypothetical protein
MLGVEDPDLYAQRALEWARSVWEAQVVGEQSAQVSPPDDRGAAPGHAAELRRRQHRQDREPPSTAAPTRSSASCLAPGTSMIALSPDGTRAYVASRKARTVTTLLTAS